MEPTTVHIPGMPQMPIHIVTAEGEDPALANEVKEAVEASFQAYAVRQAEEQRAGHQAKTDKAKQRQRKQVSLVQSI